MGTNDKRGKVLKEDLIFYREGNTGRRERRQGKRKGKNHIRHRRKKRVRRGRITLLIAAVIICFFIMSRLLGENKITDVINMVKQEKTLQQKPEITEAFLTPNPYSRPGDSIGRVKNIFVHYTANPGTSAMQNRDYFEGLMESRERSASAHFIIGCEGEIVQCIPLKEQAYAVKTRNRNSISIECCHNDESGQFTQETYDSLIALLAWLLDEYRLEPDDILRHYDCGGKLCPLYYVEHEDAWKKLKEDVALSG